MVSLRNVVIAASAALGLAATFNPAIAADKVVMRLNFTPWVMHA